MKHAAAGAFATLLLALPGALAAGPERTGPAWDGLTFDRFSSPQSGIAFDVPAFGHRIAWEIAPPGSAPEVASERVTLFDGGRALVEVEVYPNPELLDAGAWFDRDMAFLLRADAPLWVAPATEDAIFALHLFHPRTGQAIAQEMAFLALDGVLLRVLCPDAADPEALEHFDRVLATLAVEAP